MIKSKSKKWLGTRGNSSFHVWAVRLLTCAALLVGTARAAEDVYLEVTVTNAAGTVHGDRITVNGDTRSATNNTAPSPGTLFVLTNSMNRAKTNLYNQIALWPFANLSLEDISSNRFRLYRFDGAISFSFAGSWATGVLVTNISGTNRIAVDVPPSVFDADTRREVGSGVVDWLFYGTNFVGPLWPAFTNYVNTSSLQAMTNKNLWASTNRGGESTNFHHLRHVMMSGKGAPTNQARLYFGTNDGPPWIGYLAPGTNGYLSLFKTNGAAYFPSDDFVPADEMILSWLDLKNIFATRDASFYDTVNQWNTINQWLSGTNYFATHLAVHAGLDATGRVVHVQTNRSHYSWVGNLSILGTNGTSSLTNVTIYAQLAIITNLQAQGGWSAGMTHSNGTYRGVQSFYDENVFKSGAGIAFNQKTITTVANGRNTINIGTNTFIYISGSPSAPWSLGGIDGWHAEYSVDGGVIFIYFGTGQDVTITDEDGGEPFSWKRIKTLNGGDSRSSGNALGFAVYDQGIERWLFGWINRGAGTQSGVQATNAIAFLEGLGTNTSFHASSTNRVPVTIHQLTNSWTNLLEIKSSAGVPLFQVMSNGVVTLNSNVTANGVWLNSFASPAAKQFAMFHSGSVVTNSKASLTNDSFSDVKVVGQTNRQVMAWDAAGGYWTNVNTWGGVMEFFNAPTLNPAASTTYYYNHNSALTTTYDLVKLRVVKACRIKRVELKVRVSGTLASSQTVSHYIRINDTTDVAQIDTTYDAANREVGVDVDQVLAKGDFIAPKQVTPAWSPTPTSTQVRWTVYLEESP